MAIYSKSFSVLLILNCLLWRISAHWDCCGNFQQGIQRLSRLKFDVFFQESNQALRIFDWHSRPVLGISKAQIIKCWMQLRFYQFLKYYSKLNENNYMYMLINIWTHLRNTTEDSTGKKAHVTDLIKQHITFPVFTFQRQYFSLRPCFGLTINKAQGQTLQLVGLDLRTPMFSHGMPCVALSNLWHVPLFPWSLQL